MPRFNDNKSVRLGEGLTRRDFLGAGALSAGLSMGDLASQHAHAAATAEKSCIVLFLVGGPSHIDTFDPKPQAPADVRGPFRPIQTSVAGVQVCEHLPRLAALAHRLALIRSVHHDSAPIHETGHQLMQTGRLSRMDQEFPHYGSVLSWLRGPSRGTPPFVVLPAPIGNTGISVSHGQSAGFLGRQHDPIVINSIGRHHENSGERANYGMNTFGQSCLLARRLVEQGVRLVTVNMFETVFNRVTWDCHADRGALPATLDDYRTTLCPMFDQAFSSLLKDLQERGMLDSTLVVAMGEFGRTPRLNAGGGRDHWPGAWSMVMAGGGVRGGQVIGATDRIGAEPRDRPVTPAQVAASIYHALGIDPRTPLPEDEMPLVDASPIMELFS